MLNLQRPLSVQAALALTGCGADVMSICMQPSAWMDAATIIVMRSAQCVQPYSTVCTVQYAMAAAAAAATAAATS